MVSLNSLVKSCFSALLLSLNDHRLLFVLDISFKSQDDGDGNWTLLTVWVQSVPTRFMIFLTLVARELEKLGILVSVAG